MRPHSASGSLLSGAILGLSSLLGLAAFLYPFFLPALPGAGAGTMAHAADAPLLTVLLIGLCLAAAFAGLNAQQMTSKMVALLGILTALNAVLRALPGLGGFSAIFVLPILAGYAYGPTFGFLLGSLSLFVSALIGGGVGPWLPYQMFATAWVGLLSGLLPGRGDGRARGGAPHTPGGPDPAGPARPRRSIPWEAVLLAGWGGLLGLAFGALMNLWFWPFLSGGAAGTTTWQPGMSPWPAFRNYLVFYVATSLWWDVGRAAGNAALLLILARPVLRVLRRFRRRFHFDVLPEVTLTAARSEPDR